MNLNRLSVSVIVPVRNSESTLRACLSSIRGSDYPIEKLIVVDDGSVDASASIAAEYADEVISFKKKEGEGLMHVRMVGFRAAHSEVLINIDSDVVVSNDTFSILERFFRENNDIYAATGMLSLSTPQEGFFSAYKNAYMNFIFSKLPTRISFLYGSVFGVRAKALSVYNKHIQQNLRELGSDDTELGQLLHELGYEIAFLREVEVVHLKYYDLFGILRNDFKIPRYFSRLMLRFRHKSKLQLGKPVFAHTSASHLLSILVSGLLLLSIVFQAYFFTTIFFLAWIMLNVAFFNFLNSKFHFKFLVASIAFTLIDDIVMGFGIVAGIFDHLLVSLKNEDV